MQHKKLAEALERARDAADARGANIVHTADISRADRELLTHNNWLQKIVKGWYMLTRLDLADGDSTVWHSNFWDFLRIYLQSRYDEQYCLSAEASLELQIGSTLTPKQVIVIVSAGGNLINLPFGTSILTYADANNLPENTELINGLRGMPLPLALCRVTPTYYRDNSDSIIIALRSVRNTAEISKVISQYNFTRAAERVIGAYIALNMQQQAEEIQEALALAGMKVVPTDPFAKKVVTLSSPMIYSPFVARIEVIWQKHRQQIADLFPAAPGIPNDVTGYMAKVEEIYQFDAYNSLSIEGYQVSNELIAKVKSRQWNPDEHKDDKNARNVLAAKGYFEAFQSVKKTIEMIFKGQFAGTLIRKELPKWYQRLFSPSVDAGIIAAADLIGYRRDRVFIRNSRHAPPAKEFVLDAMETFFTCLENETNAAVRAVLGHYVFVFIHPYMDGNGRTARFLLNAMLASGGYSWTVVRLVNRRQYIDALELVHTEANIKPFTELIINEMKYSAKKIEGN